MFECLSVALPDRWTVFHARRFTLPSRHGEPTRELELDFLVLAPDRGLLGIEVKGGTVGRDADGWFSVAHDKTVHRIKDPSHQVQHTTHAIADYLRHHPRFAGKGQPAFGWSVCFPDGHAPRDLGPDLPRAVVLDGADLEGPWTSINRVLDVTLGTGTALSAETMAALVDVLAPRFSVTPSLSVNVAHAEASLVRLTTEQMRILDYLASTPPA